MRPNRPPRTLNAFTIRDLLTWNQTCSLSLLKNILKIIKEMYNLMMIFSYIKFLKFRKFPKNSIISKITIFIFLFYLWLSQRIPAPSRIKKKHFGLFKIIFFRQKFRLFFENRKKTHQSASLIKMTFAITFLVSALELRKTGFLKNRFGAPSYDAVPKYWACFRYPQHAREFFLIFFWHF